MSIISKEEEIQEELASVYELLLSKKDLIQAELTYYREDFNKACNRHIDSGFQSDIDWIEANNNHHFKFIEYDTYCQMIEIMNDFKDLYGKFPEHKEMFDTLQETMLEFARNEKYELAAITKIWVDKINSATLENI